MKKNSKNLIWIDLEMTGLDTSNDRIIEIATIVSDKELNILEEGPVIAISTPDNAIDGMDEWNTNQHNKSGLVDRIKKSSYTYADAEEMTIEFLEKYIDKNNILNATIKAMHESISKLIIEPKRIIIDGNYFKQYKNIPHECIIKGDEKFQNIAAASILAKTYRDELMNSLYRNFPKYSWNQNKGYATKKHRESIKKYGITNHHRKSFKLLNWQTKLNLFISLITFN